MQAKGAQIAKLIADGWQVRAVKTANKDFTRAVLQFRIVDPADDGYYTITKFQAIKYLTPETLSRLALYEGILQGRNDEHFGRRVEFNRMAKTRCAEDSGYLAAFQDCGRTSFTQL